MNKLKKALLGIVSALTIGLFAVAGTKVNAGTKNDSYELVNLLDASYNSSSGNISQPSDHSIFKSFISSKYRFQDASTDWTGNPDDLSDYSYNFQLRDSGAGFSIVIDLDEDQNATLNYIFFAKSGKKMTVGESQIASAGTDTLVSGNLNLETGTTTVTGTGNIDILKFEVVITGGVEKQYYDVKYYDSDKTTEFELLADSVEENGKVTKPQNPEKLGYTFDKWMKMSDDSEFNFDTELVTESISLYATYTPWPNIQTMDLNTMKLAKESLGTGKSDVNRELTGTIYTLLKGNTVMADTSDNVGTLGVASSCIKTGGSLQTGKNGVSFTVSNPGTITLYAKSGNSSERDFGIYKDGDVTLENVPTGHLVNSIAEYTLEISDAGTYELGSTTGSIVIYYISFEEKQLPTATFGTAVGTYNDNNTAIAFIVILENVEDVALLDAMVFTVNATLNEKVGNANHKVTTCYEALTAFGDANTFAAVEGTYYVYFTVYGITSSYNGMKLDVTFNATYDGSAITANTTYTYNA